MKIVLCGKPGSGKSTVARILAKDLHLKAYSSGDMMREIAMKTGFTIEEYAKVIPKEIDNYVDERIKKIGQADDDIIIDSRIAFHFIPDAIKIFLEVSWLDGARHIYNNQRASEKPAKSIDELAERNENRWNADSKRYLNIYKIDINDRTNYDHYIDTTGKSIPEIIRVTKRALRESRTK